jgi:hypothetical protein
MSLSVYIVRQALDGQETPISLDEWNEYIETDSDLKRPDLNHPNYGETLVLLPQERVRAEDWQWLHWTSGSISSDYPQQPMLKKIGQIARHLGAVVMSDEGELWTIDDDGRVSIPGRFEASSGNVSASATPTRTNAPNQSLSQPPPLPLASTKIAPQPWFLSIKRPDSRGISESAKQQFAEAVGISLQHYPVSLRIADLEQACGIAESLIKLGFEAEVSGYDRTKGEQDGGGQPATRPESK